MGGPTLWATDSHSGRVIFSCGWPRSLQLQATWQGTKRVSPLFFSDTQSSRQQWHHVAGRTGRRWDHRCMAHQPHGPISLTGSTSSNTRAALTHLYETNSPPSVIPLLSPPDFPHGAVGTTHGDVPALLGCNTSSVASVTGDSSILSCHALRQLSLAG